MLVRIVLDYTNDTYVFPDGKIIGRSVPHLFDTSFSLKVRRDVDLALEVAKLLEGNALAETATHFQAYEVVRSDDSIQYSIHFLRFTGEAQFSGDQTIREQQAILYRKIAGS